MKCDWCPPKCYMEFPSCFELFPGHRDRKKPGSVQELHALAHRIRPQFYDGLELDYIHRLANNKYITCNWHISHNLPAGFRFGGIYTLRGNDNVLLTPTIRGDINPTTFASNVNILYYPFQSLRFQMNLQRAATDVPLFTETTLEWQRPIDTITAKLYHERPGSGRSTVSFMRAVSEHWALGTEILLEWTEPKSLMADVALAARYTKHSHSVAATFSRQGLDVSFWQRVHERIQMASLLAWNRKTEKAIGTICYQWDFDDALVRGMINSDVSVGFMYLRSLSHLPCSIGMSVLINLRNVNRSAFGMKFVLDPSGYRRGE